MWVKFTGDFDFSPAARKGRVTIAYQAGTVKNVTRECAGQAIDVGKAVHCGNPRHEVRNGEVDRRG